MLLLLRPLSIPLVVIELLSSSYALFPIFRSLIFGGDYLMTIASWSANPIAVSALKMA